MDQSSNDITEKRVTLTPQNPSLLLICDTNIVVKMYIFKASVLFDAAYSFGHVRIHHSVICELEHWLKSKRRKYQKFGEGMISGFIASAKPKCSGLKSPDPATLPAKHRALQVMERDIPDEEKGQDTSETDRELLIYSDINNATLATDEKTLTALGISVLGENRVASFGDLVRDLHMQGLIDLKDIKSGLDNLLAYNERPAQKDRRILNDLLNAH